MTARIVHTGSVIVDVVMTIDAMPEPGGDVIASSSSFEAGGALNSILACVRDGGQVVFAGLHGTGAMGSIVAAALGASGVEVVFDPLADIDSGFTIAMVDATAERTFVTSLGAEDQWSTEHVARIPIRDGDLVYLSGYSLASDRGRAAVDTLVASMPRQAQLVVDPSPLVTDLPAAAFARALGRANVITANAREVRHLGENDDLELAGRRIVDRWPHAALVLRDGARGCTLYGGSDAAQRIPAPKVQAVDTNGAGDTHVGVMMAALARGDSLADAATRATTAAAIKVTRPGPTSVPTAKEIDAAMA